MMWKTAKYLFGTGLMLIAAVGVMAQVLHILVNDLSVLTIHGLSGPHLVVRSFRIDCFTWWGKLFHLFVELCIFAWGWGIIHDIRTKESQQGHPDATSEPARCAAPEEADA